MEVFTCPLCCGNNFISKETLVDHLSKFIKEVECPICLFKCSSIQSLSNHLTDDGCESLDSKVEVKNTKITLPIDGELDHTYTHNLHEETDFSTDTALDKLYEIKEDKSMVEENHTSEDGGNHVSDEQDMFVELINKPLSETFQMEKMHLMDESGENRYIIVAQKNGSPTVSGSTIVAKQNPDGTVSINNVEDTDEEQQEEPMISVLDNDMQLDKEVYTCNSCGINFTSVLEHIQDFHKNEDVVVEVNETAENMEQEESRAEMEQESSSAPPRRVITATGCIVERTGEEENGDKIKDQPEEEDTTDQNGRVFTRRYVPIKTRIPRDVTVQEDGADTIVIKTTEKATPQKAPYHQVVVKDMVAVEGGQKMKVYYCTACHTYVSDLNDFKSHPCKFLKYTCLDCPASYDTTKSLYAHMKVHNAEKKVKEENQVPVSGPFTCEVCETVFISNKSLKLHKRMHIPAKGKAIDPPVTPQTEDGDPPHEKYLCPICSKWIPVGYREVHDDFHDANEKFNCDICNKKFESNDYLIMHMNVHNMDKLQTVTVRQDKNLPYDCVYCDRKFARPHEKVKHERIHTGEKPHSCEICGKSFRVSYCLTLHMRTHTGARPYECTHCGKRFKAHSVYNHHLLTHSDVRAYKCPYCPKAFKTSVQLAGHKNSHTKPFSCKQCNRPFASLYAVRVHTETHRRQNNLKYSCTLCGASYARTFALKDHMKAVHKEEVEAAEQYVNSNSSAVNVWELPNIKDEKAIAEFAMDDVETNEALLDKGQDPLDP